MRPCWEAAGAFGKEPTPGLPEFPLHALISSAGIAAQAKIARVFLMWVSFMKVECGYVGSVRRAPAPVTGPTVACPEDFFGKPGRSGGKARRNMRVAPPDGAAANLKQGLSKIGILLNRKDNFSYYPRSSFRKTLRNPF